MLNETLRSYLSVQTPFFCSFSWLNICTVSQKAAINIIHHTSHSTQTWRYLEQTLSHNYINQRPNAHYDFLILQTGWGVYKTVLQHSSEIISWVFFASQLNLKHFLCKKIYFTNLTWFFTTKKYITWYH